jgi:hypothetical protein
MASRLPNPFLRPALIIGALCLPLAVYAQEESEQSEDTAETDAPAVEEIVVIAPRPGSRRRVDDEYIDPVRARVLKDLYALKRDEEEVEALDAASDRPIVSTPRVRVGYDPTEDYLRRSEISLDDPQRETTRPATIFRVNF